MNGQKQWQVVPWPCFLRPQIVVRYDNVAVKEYGRLAKVRRRGYVRVGEVNSLTNYFSVAKGEDTRMVYNGTSSGLNTSIWAPQFTLPTAVSTLQAVDKVNFMVDQNIGEMFLNLIPSEEVRPFCGVDVTNVFIEEEWEKDISGGWEIWEMKMMRLTESPYHACQVTT